MEQTTKEKIIDFIIDLVTIGLLVFVIRTFFIAPFRVSGPSMCDTLNNIDGNCVTESTSLGEFMLINKLSYYISTPKRGDIVVFKPNGIDIYYIKRIIGVGGDTVEIGEDGYVYLTPNGGTKIKLDESYLNNDNYGSTLPGSETMRVFVVPENSYFLMGDNRAHSSDSRNCFHFCNPIKPEPFITEENINGKAWITLYPFKNIKMLRRFDYKLEQTQS